MTNYWSEEEERLLKNKYLELKDTDVDGSIYDSLSEELIHYGYKRSPESIRKKTTRMNLPPVNEHSSGIRKAIVIPDMQIPYHDTVSLRAVEAYMQDNEFDYYVNLGDFLDFDMISTHNDRKPRLKEGKRVREDYEKANEILDRHQEYLGGDCEYYLIQGNHEYRMQRYLDHHPEQEGLLEVPINLNLEDRNVHWVKYWDTGEKVTIGNATFIHGRWTNKYHGKKHALRYMSNIFYGHTHDIQSFSHETDGDNKTIVGQSLGCLCRYDQKYMQGRPSNWQQGFGVFHFFPEGYFNYFVVRIFKHRFISPDGKVYDGKEL